MATLAPTPNLGLVLAAPNTGEPFSTAKMNELFTKIDTGVGQDRGRLDATESDVTTLNATRTNYLLPGSATPGLIVPGTTSQRDAYWGTPASATARASLANRVARWANVSTGCIEEYRSGPTDGANSGQTSPVAGWYPIYGALPYGFGYKTTAQSVTTEATLTFSSGDGASVAINSGAGTFTVTYGGLYRVWANIRLGGSATAADKILIVTVNGTAAANQRLLTAFAATTWDRVASLSGTLKLDAGDAVRFRAETNGNAHNPAASGTFTDPVFGLEYIQPRRT